MDGRKKRGRKAKAKVSPAPVAPQVAVQPPLPNTLSQHPEPCQQPQLSGREISMSEFENFISDVKSEPRRINDNGENLSLLSKINLLRHEIQNMKEMQEIQSLRKRNNILQIEVLKLRENLLNYDPPFCKAPEIRNEYVKQPANTNYEKNPSKESINIRNVIYNNCGQSFVIKQKDQDTPIISVKSTESLMANYQKETSKTAPRPREHNQHDKNDTANFTSVASTILNYLADKQDVFLETEKIKQLAYDMLKDDCNNFDANSSSLPMFKAEKVDNYFPAPKETRPDKVIPLPPPVQAPTVMQIAPFPMPVVVKGEVIEEGDLPLSTEVEQQTDDDLHFSYTEIKPKIIEYLSDKVDKATVISAIRRLTKIKAKSMMRQPIEEHTKLLRVYMFHDKNILVQDISKCLAEFAKDTYHSVRYYGVSLTKRIQIIPPKKTKGNSKTYSGPKNKQNDDYVILSPLNDRVLRPKFRVEMIEDLIISEDFQLVSSKPFVIRPLISEVVITSPHLKQLEPIVLRALADKTLSLTSLPVISISPKLEQYDDFPKTHREMKEFLLTDPTSGNEQYGLEQLTSNKDVIDLTDSEKGKNKRPIETTTLNQKNAKKPKMSQAVNTEDVNRDFSIVNVEDIFKKVMKGEEETYSQPPTNYEAGPFKNINQTSEEPTNTPYSAIDIENCNLPKSETKFELDFSINIDESDEDDSIVIN